MFYATGICEDFPVTGQKTGTKKGGAPLFLLLLTLTDLLRPVRPDDRFHTQSRVSSGQPGVFLPAA